jgi:hypothetical protein
MLTEKQEKTREKIQARLKKLKYRLFLAELAFATQDNIRLKDMARRIGINSGKIIRLLAEKTTTVRRKKASRLKGRI